MNYFFSTWYHALNDAFSQSSSTITSIVEAVDPKQKTNVGLSDVLLALSFGLAFIVAPELGAMADATTKVVGHLFTTLVQQAPGVGRALWPKGTIDSQLYQIGQLNTIGQQVIAGVENNLNAGLQAVQGDLETFITFTSSGAFSVPEDQRPSLPNQTQGLLLGLTTFLVSSALKSNGYLANIVTGVDPQKMTTDSSFPLPCWAAWDCANECSHRDLNCQSYDSYSHCDRWYYSRRFHSAFTLGSTTNYEQNPSDLMNTILSNNWTTGALLFENAALCAIPSSITDNPAVKNTIWNMPYNPRWWTTLTDAVAVNVFDVGDRAIRDIMYIYNTQNKYNTCHEDAIAQNDSLINHNPPSIMTNHPNNTLFQFGPNGPDFSCTSQLDLGFVTSWGDVANGLYY